MQTTRQAPTSGTPLLEIDDLAVQFATRRGTVRAVDGVSLRLHEGEILGIVGESGSGKSMTLLSILRLIPRQGRIARGAIRYRGQNLLDLPMGAMRALRGGALRTLRRLSPPERRIARRAIGYRGQNLLVLPMGALRALRGGDIAMICQDPMTTLNPVFPVGEQTREALRIHGRLDPDRKRR